LLVMTDDIDLDPWIWCQYVGERMYALVQNLEDMNAATRYSTMYTVPKQYRYLIGTVPGYVGHGNIDGGGLLVGRGYARLLPSFLERIRQ
jgi:hypothetical protein